MPPQGVVSLPGFIVRVVDSFFVFMAVTPPHTNEDFPYCLGLDGRDGITGMLPTASCPGPLHHFKLVMYLGDKTMNHNGVFFCVN